MAGKKPRFMEFLRGSLNGKQYLEQLFWIDEEIGLFCIIFKHKNDATWQPKDAAFCMGWDVINYNCGFETRKPKPQDNIYYTEARHRVHEALKKCIHKGDICDLSEEDQKKRGEFYYQFMTQDRVYASNVTSPASPDLLARALSEPGILGNIGSLLCQNSLSPAVSENDSSGQGLLTIVTHPPTVVKEEQSVPIYNQMEDFQEVPETKSSALRGKVVPDVYGNLWFLSDDGKSAMSINATYTFIKAMPE